MLYIVLIAVARSRAQEWESYMSGTHIQDMMDTGCFESAYMARDEAADTAERVGWRVIYVLEDQRSLDRYMSDHAAAMREDHTRAFGGVVQASREILPVTARA